MNIFAHRGASAYAPENTLQAFSLAARMGADGVELDVQMSGDGALVVIHDSTVDRTSNGKGSVCDMTLGALKALDFSCGMPGFQDVRIPLLEEVYTLLEPTGLCINVEIKSEAVAATDIWAKLTATEAACRMKGRILYSSFDHSILPPLRDRDPEAKIGLLYRKKKPDIPWAYARRMGADALHPPYSEVLSNPDYVKNCHEAALDVNVWTVDDPASIAKLQKLGVNTLITNKPDVALGVREQSA